MNEPIKPSHDAYAIIERPASAGTANEQRKNDFIKVGVVWPARNGGLNLHLQSLPIQWLRGDNRVVIHLQVRDDERGPRG
jgi:hypothetical protein